MRPVRRVFILEKMKLNSSLVFKRFGDFLELDHPRCRECTIRITVPEQD
jgi:hypothetical protein